MKNATRKTKLPEKLYAPKEREIEQACTQLLQYDGWRPIVTDPPHLRGLGVSEPGIPDRLYIRYTHARWIDEDLEKAMFSMTLAQVKVEAEVLWIEWKRKGGKAAQHQKDWHLLEEKRGALVWVAGTHFPASFEGFRTFYWESGLNRGKV